MADHVPRPFAIPVLAWLAVVLLVAIWVAPATAAAGDQSPDFPPLVEPGRRIPVERPATPEATPAAPETLATPAAEAGTEPAMPEPYRLGVGDDIMISVLAAPELSGSVTVRPDGAITTPGAGTVHALGRTPEDVGAEIERKLGEILRHPRVDLVVKNFGPQRVYVIGEVDQPGDRPFYKGMSALQAVAAAGGVKSTGKPSSVLLLRRTSADTTEVRRIDLTLALKGEPGLDPGLRPFDIVYVPRTFIANVDLVIDQYVRQLIPPFTLYYAGWTAAKIAGGGVKVVGLP